MLFNIETSLIVILYLILFLLIFIDESFSGIMIWGTSADF